MTSIGSVIAESLSFGPDGAGWLTIRLSRRGRHREQCQRSDTQLADRCCGLEPLGPSDGRPIRRTINRTDKGAPMTPNDHTMGATSVSGHEVISNVALSADVHRLVIRAPRVAAVRQPGQFVIVRLGPGAERIPLTIAESDPEEGSIVRRHPSRRQEHVRPRCARSRRPDQRHLGPLGRPSDLITEWYGDVRGRRSRRSGDIPDRPAARRPRRRSGHGARRAHRRELLYRRRIRLVLRIVVVHRRWQRRPTRSRHRHTRRHAGNAFGRRRLRRRAGADDARRCRGDRTVRGADDRVAQPDHGRRHRYVRWVPGDGRRDDAVRLRRRARVRWSRRRLRRAVRPPRHLREAEHEASAHACRSAG